MRRSWGSEWWGCFLILVLFLVSCISSWFSCAAASSEEEMNALIDIKHALGVGNGVLYGWSLSEAGNSTTPCDWEGVTCDNSTSELVGLNLTHLGLAGTISPSVGKLQNLRILDMSDNNVTGAIPAEIGGCESLRVIDLSYNSLIGEIPLSLSQLKNLEVLALQSNRLSGPIPDALSKLPNLMTLNLAYNNLSGEIPAMLYWSQTLEILMLRGNFLTGEISPDLCQLTNLWYFNVRENNLTGTIPNSIGNCSSFEILDVGYNQLTGEIPQNFGFLQVSTLSLENNKLTGSIPDVLGLLQALLILDLSNNQLEGPIPTSFGNLVYLNKLYLQENLLTGTIPPVLGNMTRLQYLLLDDNQLTGPIPPELGNLQLFEVRLAGNRLSGGVPVSLSSCTSLNKLDLHGNLLTGAIPQGLERLDNLTHLNLSTNYLTGGIPLQLANVVNLDTLDLSSNNLSGHIPPSIGKLEHLLYISLEGNHLTGVIPAELGNLSSLMYLDISRNNLYGGIPLELGHLQQLDTLLLEHNNLSGPIPQELAGCIMLSTMNVSYNNLDGSIPLANTFSRFPPSSFLGNPNLCGTQLSRTCSSYQMKVASAIGATTIWIVTAVAVCLLAVVIFAIFKSAKLRRPVKTVDMSYEGPPRLIMYHMGMVTESYEEWVRITDNLTEQSLVGSGASSKVYKCTLKSGQAVAIKKLYNHHPQNIQEFENELQMLEKIKHRNLVTLRGYSLSSLGHFLLYDYMEVGSLYDLLHGPVRKVKLDWSIRLNIALGAAQGLAYLHHDCAPRIVHRDIKTGNILLDANLEPHISDFGIAKNIQLSKSHTSTYVMGTIGYIDPEYARTSMLNEKSDVYSYGIVLLELITDRKAVNSEGNLLSWVMQKVSSNTVLSSAVAPDIKSSCSNTNSIEKVFKLALRCTDKNPNVRPTMYDVVEVLLSLISGPVPANQSNSMPKLSSSTNKQYIDMFVNPMYYKDSLGSESLSDVRLLAKFGEVIS
ncbi:unnamed protein product [Calypogeia fissa]